MNMNVGTSCSHGSVSMITYFVLFSQYHFSYRSLSLFLSPYSPSFPPFSAKMSNSHKRRQLKRFDERALLCIYTFIALLFALHPIFIWQNRSPIQFVQFSFENVTPNPFFQFILVFNVAIFIFTLFLLYIFLF